MATLGLLYKIICKRQEKNKNRINSVRNSCWFNEHIETISDGQWECLTGELLQWTQCFEN